MIFRFSENNWWSWGLREKDQLVGGKLEGSCDPLGMGAGREGMPGQVVCCTAGHETRRISEREEEEVILLAFLLP